MHRGDRAETMVGRRVRLADRGQDGLRSRGHLVMRNERAVVELIAGNMGELARVEPCAHL